MPEIVEISKRVNMYEITDISDIVSISKKVKSWIVKKDYMVEIHEIVRIFERTEIVEMVNMYLR